MNSRRRSLSGHSDDEELFSFAGHHNKHIDSHYHSREENNTSTGITTAMRSAGATRLRHGLSAQQQQQPPSQRYLTRATDSVPAPSPPLSFSMRGEQEDDAYYAQLHDTAGTPPTMGLLGTAVEVSLYQWHDENRTVGMPSASAPPPQPPAAVSTFRTGIAGLRAKKKTGKLGLVRVIDAPQEINTPKPNATQHITNSGDASFCASNDNTLQHVPHTHQRDTDGKAEGHRIAEEEQRQRIAEEERRQRIAEEERQRIAEEEQRQRIAEEERRQRIAEEERQRIAEEERRQRIAEEERRQRIAEEERQRIAEEERRQRIAEEERQRIAEEEQRQRIAEEERRQRIAEEERRQRIAEEERQRIAEEERRQRIAEEERQRIAEEEQRQGSAVDTYLPEAKFMAAEIRCALTQVMDSRESAWYAGVSHARDSAAYACGSVHRGHAWLEAYDALVTLVHREVGDATGSDASSKATNVSSSLVVAATEVKATDGWDEDSDGWGDDADEEDNKQRGDSDNMHHTWDHHQQRVKDKAEVSKSKRPAAAAVVLSLQRVLKEAMAAAYGICVPSQENDVLTNKEAEDASVREVWKRVGTTVAALHGDCGGSSVDVQHGVVCVRASVLKGICARVLATPAEVHREGIARSASAMLAAVAERMNKWVLHSMLEEERGGEQQQRTVPLDAWMHELASAVATAASTADETARVRAETSLKTLREEKEKSTMSPHDVVATLEQEMEDITWVLWWVRQSITCQLWVALAVREG